MRLLREVVLKLG